MNFCFFCLLLCYLTFKNTWCQVDRWPSDLKFNANIDWFTSQVCKHMAYVFRKKIMIWKSYNVDGCGINTLQSQELQLVEI